MNLYVYKNKQHEDLFQQYFNHYDTPHNNLTYEKLKVYTKKLDNLFLYIVDNNEIVATFGAIEINLDNHLTAIKMPHRLHVRRDYTRYHNKFIDEYFEPKLYEWFEMNNIKSVIQTINEKNIRAALLSWKRQNRRRLYGIKHVNEYGKKFILGQWKILPYLIFEQNVWQYAAWLSINNLQWNKNWRRTKSIGLEMSDILNNQFEITEDGWVI